ncbi:MAG TPA: sulfatase-like hydrolase/transferase [Phycisphaerae bacterium]|nr:sulfatase-like hydrolase/transferase [Phycisphaerae bacterium]
MERPRPKWVIWITTDHMRYDCIGAHGNEMMHTPNLDRLVRQGVSFDDCYAQNPLCMPSRCSFMTGLYPQQTGVTQNGNTLRPDFEPTVAHAFKAGGLQTAQIGKLHFQEHEDHDLDPRARHDYGFDTLWASEEPGCYNDAYMTWLYTEHPHLVQKFRVPRSTSPQRIKEREGRVVDAPWQMSHSGFVGGRTETYLGVRHATRQFVHMGFYAPHPPLNPTTEMFAPYAGKEMPPPRCNGEEWHDKPEPLARLMRSFADWTVERFVDYRRHFYAMVTGVDLAVGSLLAFLERIGMIDDTLICFGSDHGDMCGDHRMILKHASFYDELMRMPWVLFWPRGFGTKGRRVSGLVEMVDQLPSLLDLASCPVPEVMVGRSYAGALLLNESVEARQDVLAYHEPGWAMLRTDDHKYIRYGYGQEVLYDLHEATPEVVNRADADPKTLASMRERMLQRVLEASRTPQVRHFRY